MKNKSRWLALMLTGSMMISPLSYTRTYAAENEQQYETNLQETVEVEEADPDKKQDESQTEDAGNVKEDQTEESDKVDNSSDKSDNQNSIEAETKPNLENNSENNSENNLENNSEEKDTETTGKNPGTTVSDQVADEKTDNKDTQIKDKTGKSEPSTDSNDSTNTPEPELPPLQEAPSVTGESVKVIKEDAEEFKMFKVSESAVTKKDGQLEVTIKTKNTSFDALYLGSKDDLLKTSIIEGTKTEDGAWEFTFKVPLEKAGQTIPVALRKVKGHVWYDKQYLWMYIPNPGETSTPDPAPTPTPTPEATVANGIYSMDVASSSSMFKVVDCILTAKDGKMNAVLTLSGTGYGYLYMGTKEEAASADQSSWIPYQVNKEGKYTYTVPVEALDKEIAVAAYSIKKGIWYDRMLTFQSETMRKIADLNSTDSENKGDSGNNGNTGNSGTTGGSNNTGNTGTNNSAFPGGSVSGTNSGKTDGNDGKADNVSKYESDTSGSTSHVDSGTTLKDGVYTPDRFTWSGGTGKVQITCNKVTIQNGQAYATLVFSSDHYQYVKANGNKYYTTKGGGSATAVIPVALNQNNKIIGMTDKMSVAHEIEYTIFIYLAAANGGTSANGTVASTNSNQKLDEKAPEIIGLEYQSETKLDYAEYFKIYHYDQGIVLLEIDMTKDTARDPEKAEDKKSEADNSDSEKSSKKKVASVTINRSEDAKSADTKKSDTDSKSDASVEESAASDNNSTSEQDLAAELYKGNVVKYLIVPENVEIPVGLEQDMIIVKKPVDHTYAESDEILNTMKDLDLLDNVAAVGMKSKDCTVSEIADKMKAKDGEKNAEVAYAGTADKLKLKNLVKSEVNLALFTGDILPGAKSEETEVEAKDTDKKDSKDTEETLTLEEKTEQFEELTEKLAMLGIPVFVDRSSEEKTELGKQEWIKVYGVLYGCEELTNEKFDAAVAAAEK
ncbi:hypothetical protein DWY35_07645 [Ruminococcus sp. AF25-13]|jgi:hypothetical protein|nr:hypothetical protein [Mediterraneibacter faecis]RGF27125.1 hypothetical protein DW106_10850 [Ruminococcus sp. AM09-18-1]RGG01543.1 hypothetical protein DWY85_10335 [Ruminococcus sp. AF27-3]RGG08629.1 hypothetical protein DWY75_10125 [Ruminococcus sp. AF27-11AA]RGG09164.1 hypothetical protein DWY78_09930 [Ruminococcus sp. AF27-12AA]RGG28998.1 hypothetical protein DWY35_07645 [Ruminococcus sp. AF25-13]RGG39038.1 hypothetical protein DWY13_06015 [Ruminococcus sp. AF24-16]